MRAPRSGREKRSSRHSIKQMSFAFDVFLSYSSLDGNRVETLAGRLRDAGVKVWYDGWRIPAGADIRREIDSGLQQSRVVVACISPNALASGAVQAEWSSAWIRDTGNY